MHYRSHPPASAGTPPLAPIARKQRRHHRQRVQTLAYVNLGQSNGGVIRDLSESGLAVQAMTPLRVNQHIQVRFDLLSPRLRVETAGRVAWTDSVGQAGVEFVDLSRRSRRLLREWLFTQLLARTFQLSWDSVFIHEKQGEQATELIFSAAPRPVICLEPPPVAGEPQTTEVPSQALRFSWCPFPISLRNLTRLADGLILLCAVLFFWVASLAITQVLPSWPVAIGIAVVSGGLFAGAYWLLFAVWNGTTPGAHLARLAGADSAGGERPEEDRPRFR